MGGGSITDKNGDVMAIEPAVSVYFELKHTASDFWLCKKKLI